MSVLLLEDGTSRLLNEDGTTAVLLEEVNPGPPASPADGRVLIAPGGNPLDATPAWEAFDMLTNCRCSGFEITTGRQSEFDKTDTGTASVFFHDRAGVLDDPDLVGSPILLQVQDPNTGLWHQQFRGTIDEPDYELEPSWAANSNVNMRCKDIFDYLAGVEMVVGVHGNPIPADHTHAGGACFWDSGLVQGRIEDLLGTAVGAGLPNELTVVFTGNVILWQTWYDAGDSILTAIRDAADAEFPGIANVYVDRYGRVNFHGRFARFDPNAVAQQAGNEAWDFHRWDAATREDVTAGIAQIREFAYNIPKSRIYNAAISWPRNDWIEATDTGPVFSEKAKTNQVRTNATSISRYGYRALPPMGDLILMRSSDEDTGPRTGAEECQLFAEFYVNNYSSADKNLRSCTFKSIHPDDDRAADTWDLMLRADISDIIALTVDEAGLSDVDYYIEGFQKTVQALNPDFDMVTVTPNLSPSAYYTDNVFE